MINLFICIKRTSRNRGNEEKLDGKWQANKQMYTEVYNLISCYISMTIGTKQTSQNKQVTTYWAERGGTTKNIKHSLFLKI
jgi:hypothetical protein